MEKKKRVLQILYSGLGGHAAVVFALTEAGESKKHLEHHVLFYGIEEVKPSYIEKCKANGIAWASILKDPGIDVASFYAVIRIIKEKTPDVVLLHSVNLILVVYLASLAIPFRLIAVEHQANHLKTKKEWVFSRLCLLLAKRTVYLTETYMTEIQQRLPLFFRKNKVTVIPNGIDVDQYKPHNLQKDAIRPYTIGMISRINDLKDHDTLLRAFAQLPDKKVRLFIAGEGPNLPRLKEIATQLDIIQQVNFLGLLEGENVIKFFHSLDCYVHATFGETMSTAIMQAMACGLPVIATEIDGTINMITNEENGLFVPPGNAKALAEAIKRLLNNPQTAWQLGDAARQHAIQFFSQEKMFSAYNQLVI